jgi:hypothetical protein
MIPIKPTLGAALLQVGQRVSRKNTDELGTVTEANGRVKVKWDSGRTSYFRRLKSANVRLLQVTKLKRARL